MGDRGRLEGVEGEREGRRHCIWKTKTKQFSSVTLGSKSAMFNLRPARLPKDISTEKAKDRRGDGWVVGVEQGMGGPPMGDMLVQGGHPAQSTGRALGTDPRLRLPAGRVLGTPATRKTTPACPWPASLSAFPSG